MTFGSEKSMKDAIERMNGQELDGRKITVTDAQSKERGGGAGRGGGGGEYGGGYGGGSGDRVAYSSGDAVSGGNWRY